MNARWATAVFLGVLCAFVAGCSDDEGAPQAPTATATVSAPSTATFSATRTAAATATATPTTGTPLGSRLLTVQRPESAYDSTAADGGDASEDPWSAPVLEISAGVPDANGIAPLQLLHDVILGITLADSSVQCFKFSSAGSQGQLACAPALGQRVIVRQEAPPPGNAFITTLREDASPAGSVFMIIVRDQANLPSGSTPQDCATATYTLIGNAYFTSFSARAAIDVAGGEPIAIEGSGSAFDCNDWTNPNGVGVLVSPAFNYEPGLFDGGAANLLVLAGGN